MSGEEQRVERVKKLEERDNVNRKRKIDSAYCRRQEKMPCKIRHVSVEVGTRALSECDVGEWQFWSSLKVSAQAHVRLRAKDNAKRVVLVRPHVSRLTQVERGEKKLSFCGLTTSFCELELGDNNNSHNKAGDACGGKV